MEPIVSIVVESTADLDVMNEAAAFLDEMEIPFEICAQSPMYAPNDLAEYATNAVARGLQVVIAGCRHGMALGRMIAGGTTLPVVVVPLCGDVEAQDVREDHGNMPLGVPLAMVAKNEAHNAAVLAMQMLALVDPQMAEKLAYYKSTLAQQMQRFNVDLTEVEYLNKTN